MERSSFFTDMAKPFIVLVCICLAAAALLSFSHGVTDPIIKEAQQAKAEATRAAVLEGAEGFTELECDAGALGITGAYRENTGLGYVMTAAYKGYGGDVTVTVGLDNDGCVVGISADVSSESQGVGTKAGAESYLLKYVGSQGEAAVDTITTATFSSTAVKKGVNAVLAAFDTVKEAK